MGQHQGKGPKGYQRSDERTKELLCERLRDDPEIDPSEVTITVQGGKITLEGTVDSRQTKNAIEEIADQFGTQDVQNNLRIQRQSQQSAKAGPAGQVCNQWRRQRLDQETQLKKNDAATDSRPWRHPFRG